MIFIGGIILICGEVLGGTLGIIHIIVFTTDIIGGIHIITTTITLFGIQNQRLHRLQHRVKDVLQVQYIRLIREVHRHVNPILQPQEQVQVMVQHQQLPHEVQQLQPPQGVQVVIPHPQILFVLQVEQHHQELPHNKQLPLQEVQRLHNRHLLQGVVLQVEQHQHEVVRPIRHRQIHQGLRQVEPLQPLHKGVQVLLQLLRVVLDVNHNQFRQQTA